MARKKITVTKLAANGSVADPAGNELDAAEDHYVTGVPLEELMLEVKATEAGTLVIGAGDDPPALEAGQGNLSVVFAKNDVKLLGPFTSGRFIQAGAEAGQLFVNVPEGMTGTIKAIHLPREA